ncbi:MAG: metallophosphoesterase [Bacteroidetes bacterium]|jgi:hypothetical protein|nr:metallophosphoesterase [Bacteroidota bacterium]
MKKLILFSSLILLSTISFSQVSLISAGSSWKYLDNGSDQNTQWTSPTFSDAAWNTGNAELGYGDGDEATVVSYGPNSGNKYITTYFRKTFTVSNPSQFTNLALEMVRDDGAVVYINGQEVFRTNMPSGTPFYTTEASSTVAFGAEDDWNAFSASPLTLVSGTNTIAVEIHQDDPGSSDISFNLKMDGITVPQNFTLERGPYLNQASPSSIIVKWKTTQATDTKLSYGSSPSALTQTITVANSSTDHEVHITGLQPFTQYYYSISCSGNSLTTPAADLYFRTMPNYGQRGDYRFWVTGDAGAGSTGQRDVRTAFDNYNAGRVLDGWLWLGDNAYEGGSQSEYQSNVFSNNTYENNLKNTAVWPAAGNHDYNNHIPFSPSPAYFDIFSLPSNGECGGVASGSEQYYSYNYGNIHFIVLESFDVSRASNGPMATWLQSDLAANTQEWTIAYWHHPPYTKGSHDSDNPTFIDYELPELRQNIIPILENYGVDLILNGHSHVYERSYLLDGHYGYSSSFQQSMKLDNTSGSYPADCPYMKNTTQSSSHKGTVYVVCGCSAKHDSSPASGWPHPAFYNYTFAEMGSMAIDIKDNMLQGKFVTTNGTVFDSFTIVKNAGGNTDITICPDDTVTLVPSFPSAMNWFPGNMQADSIQINTPVSTVYYASDLAGCPTDTFTINVVNLPSCNPVGLSEAQNTIFKVYPTILREDQKEITIESGIFAGSFIELLDINGKNIWSTNLSLKEGNNVLLLDAKMNGGLYILRIKTANQEEQTIKLLYAE